ncbi:hypothetical protein HDK77DRAFT_256545 [Phyllosticta capitalensis]
MKYIPPAEEMDGCLYRAVVQRCHLPTYLSECPLYTAHAFADGQTRRPLATEPLDWTVSFGQQDRKDTVHGDSAPRASRSCGRGLSTLRLAGGAVAMDGDIERWMRGGGPSVIRLGGMVGLPVCPPIHMQGKKRRSVGGNKTFNSHVPLRRVGAARERARGSAAQPSPALLGAASQYLATRCDSSALVERCGQAAEGVVGRIADSGPEKRRRLAPCFERITDCPSAVERGGTERAAELDSSVCAGDVHTLFIHPTNALGSMARSSNVASQPGGQAGRQAATV